MSDGSGSSLSCGSMPGTAQPAWPLPGVRGKDRFRWDNKNGDGTFYYNQCGAGSGVDPAMGLRFKEAAPLIEQVIGEARAERPQARGRSEEEKRAALRSLWLASTAIRRDDRVDQWFRNCGIAISIYLALGCGGN